MPCKRFVRWAEIKALMLEQQADAAGFPGTALLEQPETISLVEAGLEEKEMPMFGYADPGTKMYDHVSGGVQEYITWFSDGEDSRYEAN